MATHLSAHHPLHSVNIRTAAALRAHQPQVDSLTTSEKGTTTQRPNFVNGFRLSSYFIAAAFGLLPLFVVFHARRVNI